MTATLPTVAELAAQVAHHAAVLDRLQATLRALDRLPPDDGSSVTETKLLHHGTPPAIPWPSRQAPKPEPLTPSVPVELIDQAVVILDAEGRVTYWSAQATSLFGWTANEVQGLPPPFLPDDRLDEHDDLLSREIRSGPLKGIATVRRHRQGELLSVTMNAQRTTAGLVQTFSLAATPAQSPIIELKPAPLTEAEPTLRLATLGRSAVGVVHDFNNLLAVIRGNLDLLSEDGGLSLLQREAASAASLAVDQAAGVTRHLLTLVKPEPQARRACDLGAVVREVDRLIRAMVGARTQVALIVPATTLRVDLDPAEVTQMLLNLVANARDAMPEGGTLTIRTAVQTIEPHRAGWPEDVPHGEFVTITVSDTGHGMDEATRMKIFDPFFTTKGAGTGLGLAIVRDVVARAAGHVDVESSPGWGTQVRLYLPRAR